MPTNSPLPEPRSVRWSHETVDTKKRRKRRFSARPFFITLIVVGLFAVLAFLRDGSFAKSWGLEGRLGRRGVGVTQDGNVAGDCHLIHNHNDIDKCAFVFEHCSDEKAGLIDYLGLYYCKASHRTRPFVGALLVAWLGLLFTTIGAAASDFFCVNLSTISSMWNMSDNIAGVTLLAFGNGSPDVFSTYAAMGSNSGSLAVGELIGAACFITAVVAGAMALSRPFEVTAKPFMRDLLFFIFASAFSMFFLWDGKLWLWECLCMIAFYFSYVAFVISSHWWAVRRQKQHDIDVTSRSHVVTEGGEEAEVPYRDDPEAAVRPKALSRGASEADFRNLHRANSDYPEPDRDEQERMQEQGAALMNQGMRLPRPSMKTRRPTHVYTRPSLLGALEFNAVRDKLKKARNIHDIPIGQVVDRRWSSDQLHLRVDTGGSQSSHVANPAPTVSNLSAVPDRARAVSVNDAEAYRGGMAFGHQTKPKVIVSQASNETSSSQLQVPEVASTLVVPETAVETPLIEVTPPVTRSTTPMPQEGNAVNLTSQLPKLSIPPAAAPTPTHGRTPSATSPFPIYQDYFTHSPRPPSTLPDPSIDAISILTAEFPFPHQRLTEKPWKWWPYSILPPPGVFFATLFPTFVTWRDKTVFSKFVAVITAPSILLLTLTLPVVDARTDDDESENDEGNVPTSHAPTISVTTEGDGQPPRQGGRSQAGIVEPYRDDPTSPAGDSGYVSNPNPSISVSDQPARPRLPTDPLDPPIIPSPTQLPKANNTPNSSPDWNRWLVIIQTFTAPLFIIVVVWSGYIGEQDPHTLLIWTLASLVFSLFILLFIMKTTSPTHTPPWRNFLSFLGFVVAIAWISTVANEVVGVLKAIGVIIDMSDAILGLTIFAIGNSIGDLVADITVAKQGFPIMALSACFGGPMLNILVGVGFSGAVLAFKQANKRVSKHPGKQFKFKPYILDVSTTLVISGGTLLLTLVVLLIAVPMNKWRFDRKIGGLLVGIWVLATCFNVVGELVGWHDDIANFGNGWLGDGDVGS